MKLLPRVSRFAALAAVLALIPISALANDSEFAPGILGDKPINGISADVHAEVRTSDKDKFDKKDGSNGKIYANEALTNRIENLNKLKLRFNNMEKFSVDQHANLKARIDAQIAALTALKAKIDASGTTTLKADIESITKDYRIYLLVLPQARIIAATDRIQTVSAHMKALETKLQARITAAQTAGKDVSAANTAYADFKVKVADADAQAKAAALLVANLKADNGDATIAASNKTALTNAAAKIQIATQDLKQARADIEVIVKATKTNK